MEPVSKILTREDCDKIIARIVSYPFEITSHKISKFSTKAVGFMGDHFRLTITFCEKPNRNSTHKMTFFMKTTPQFNENQVKYVEGSGIFKKEVLLYQNLLSELLKITTFGPRCYFVQSNCLVLEDLSSYGFKNHPRLEYFNEKHCLALLETLGQFHAATIIYEERQGFKINEKFSEEIKETSYSFIEGEPRQKWCVSVTKCIIDLIKLSSEDEEIEELCQKLHKFVFEEMPQMIEPSKKFKNILTHDDLWCNNMMFDAKGRCVFVDYQMMRYMPPALEFLVALLINVKSEYLQDNFEKLKKFYYSTFANELKKHNLDADKLISMTEFEETLKYYKLAAIIEATMYGTHVYISEETSEIILADINNFNEFSFLNRSKFLIPAFKTDPHFKNRISNLLVPLVETLKEM